MTRSYTPRIGSLPQRVIAHLQTGASTIAPKQLTELFGVKQTNAFNLLQPAIKHGLLVRVGRGLGVMYALGEGTAPAAAATPAPRKKHKSRSAAAATKRHPMPEAGAKPVAALWDDGDICLYHLQVNDDETVTMAEAQARQLQRFLNRVFGQREAGQ